jgi:hypothetical protein
LRKTAPEIRLLPAKGRAHTRGTCNDRVQRVRVVHDGGRARLVRQWFKESIELLLIQLLHSFASLFSPRHSAETWNANSSTCDCLTVDCSATKHFSLRKNQASVPESPSTPIRSDSAAIVNPRFAAVSQSNPGRTFVRTGQRQCRCTRFCYIALAQQQRRRRSLPRSYPLSFIARRARNRTAPRQHQQREGQLIALSIVSTPVPLVKRRRPKRLSSNPCRSQHCMRRRGLPHRRLHPTCPWSADRTRARLTMEPGPRAPRSATP